jgi:hypothetical protein
LETTGVPYVIIIIYELLLFSFFSFLPFFLSPFGFDSYWQAANLTKPCIVGKNAVNIFVCALAI